MTEAWIVVHDQDAGNALARSARALAGRVVALSLGAGGLSDADLTLAVDLGPEVLIEACARPVADVLRERGATVVAFGGDVRSRQLAGQVAAHLGVAVTNVTGLVCTEPLVVTRLAHGGVAVATEEITAPVAVLVLEPGALAPSDVAGEGGVEALEIGAVDAGLTLVETRRKGGEQVDLTAAKRVVGVGRGFATEADLELARALASRVGAELACSRPISEGVGWMTADRYLGVSGATIKPELYLAVGISGQVQHLVGVNHAKVIVAINKDKNAPIFQHADIGVVGDLYQVLPALIDAL